MLEYTATFLYTPEGTQQLTTELASLAKPLVLFRGLKTTNTWCCVFQVMSNISALSIIFVSNLGATLNHVL